MPDIPREPPPWGPLSFHSSGCVLSTPLATLFFNFLFLAAQGTQGTLLFVSQGEEPCPVSPAPSVVGCLSHLHTQGVITPASAEEQGLFQLERSVAFTALGMVPPSCLACNSDPQCSDNGPIFRSG